MGCASGQREGCESDNSCFFITRLLLVDRILVVRDGVNTGGGVRSLTIGSETAGFAFRDVVVRDLRVKANPSSSSSYAVCLNG